VLQAAVDRFGAAAVAGSTGGEVGMVPDKVTGFEAELRRSDAADEESWHRLISAWAGFVPFREAGSADALVSMHEDQKATTKTPDREAA
jgi:hypothetical protein